MGVDLNINDCVDFNLQTSPRKRKNSSSEEIAEKKICIESDLDALPIVVLKQENNNSELDQDVDNNVADDKDESDVVTFESKFNLEPQTVTDNNGPSESDEDSFPADIFCNPNATEQSPNENINIIQINIVSQRETMSLAMDCNSTIEILKSVLQGTIQMDKDQLCLISNKQVLPDDSSLKDLNIQTGSYIYLIIKYHPSGDQCGQVINPTNYWPSHYTSLGLSNFNLSDLQEKMQKDFNENPELMRQALLRPEVQDLMNNPKKILEMWKSIPGSVNLLVNRPDIHDALQQPHYLEESLKISKDPNILHETIEKMVGAKNSDTVPVEHLTIPNCETMMKMTAQNPAMLTAMFASPQYKTMIEGMVANPDWTEKMLLNNPLMASNQQMRQQVKSFLPMFLKQLQNPDYIAMISNPKALKSMMKVQQGILAMQSEAPNLIETLTGFPNYSVPGNFDVEIEGGVQGEVVRPSKGEVDPMSIMMERITRHTKEGKVGLSAEERFQKELDLMEKMGFTEREANVSLLTATFGDVNIAVSQLLLCKIYDVESRA